MWDISVVSGLFRVQGVLVIHVLFNAPILDYAFSEHRQINFMGCNLFKRVWNCQRSMLSVEVFVKSSRGNSLPQTFNSGQQAPPPSLPLRQERVMWTHQCTCVCGVRSIILKKTWQAEVGHLAHQVAVDQYVPGCQVSMDVVHVTQVLHSCCYASQHSHQLDHCELPVVLL